MATFSNTKIRRVNALIDSYKSKLDSPYNIYLDRPPVPVTWYNQSKEHTSMDEATREVYEYVGADSPVRYNKIKDAVIYGLPVANINWTVGDFGLTSDEISGDTVVLPDTWVPYPNDYFSVDHLNKDMLFKVTNVTENTFPNGANFYKVEFTYEHLTSEEINKQVVQEFRMVLDNVGTEYKSIIKEDIYATAEKLDSIILNLQTYYIQSFFKDSLQTFVYSYDGSYFYDPYMVEFLKRNSILRNSGGFIYIQHALPMLQTFTLDYAKSVFRRLEQKDLSTSFYNRGIGKLIENPTTIFYYRTTEYYEVTYSNIQFAKSLDIMDGVLVDRIRNNDASYTGIELYKNIIVKYFNDGAFSDEELRSLETMDILDNKECFYYIPMVIYILLQTINNSIAEK